MPAGGDDVTNRSGGPCASPFGAFGHDVEVTGPQPAQPPRRLARSFVDMLWALIPLVIIILALAYFCDTRNVDPVRVVDPQPDLKYLATVVDYPVLGPAHLPDGWRPTSSALRESQPGEDPAAAEVSGVPPAGLSIGYVTPSDEFCRYTQSSQSLQSLLDDLLPGAKETGTAEIGGRTWTLVRGDSETGMYTQAEGSVLVLEGTAPRSEFEDMAAGLTPVVG